MATSGYKDFTVTNDGFIKIRFKWTSGTPNVINNYTPVNYVIQLISTNSKANIISSVSKNYSVTIDGQTWTGTNSVALNGGVTRTLISGSKNVYHNSDGTKTFNYSFSQAFNITYSGVSIGTITGSGSGVLDPIYRASVLGTISNFTIGNAITIPITKYSTSYSDTLNIYVNNTWIKRVEGLTNNQSISFTTTELNNIYTAMSSVTSSTFKFENTTYSGPNIIGTSTKTAIGTIASTIKPAISSVTLNESLANIKTQFGFLVQNKSKLAVTINAAAGSGSQIKTYETTINGNKYLTNTFTTDVLKTSGTNSYTVKVTDKRGRSVSKSGTFSVTAYSNPSISNLKVSRCNADGTLNDDGSYAIVNASASITSLSSKNTKNFRLQYKPKNSTTWTTDYTYTGGYTLTITNRIISSISNNNSYDFRVLVTDFFETDISKSYSLSTGQPILDIKADGKGIAFFRVSDKKIFQVGKDIFDRFDTRIPNGLAAYGGGSNQIDPDTTIESLILTDQKTPYGGFAYIRTIFYSTKSVTSNRTQIAYPYNTNKCSCYRYYISGTGWSDWKASDIQDLNVVDTTGRIWFGNGLLIQWGRLAITPTAANTVTQGTITFPVSYDYTPRVEASPNVSVPNLVTTSVGTGTTYEVGKSKMIIYMTRTNTASTIFQWMAIGIRKV